jgi:UDP-N-acetylglucosamine diphosphorylase / glucose-1-phosphate thymidylyltransferase / UDP-N-acetylgalactosamine diphosphorylase / glucosamine-1-phosphate N-acetyltransferase / galactosamine-1-phosphate N-acetyltransferase
MQTKKQIAGIIMAAGRGSRMVPLTNSIPKPLARVDGKTLLEINMTKLEPLVDFFVIVISYLGEQIRSFVGYNFNNKKVYYVDSLSPVTGSAGAFRFGVFANEFTINSDYILSNSDNILGKEFYDKLHNYISVNRDSTCFMTSPEPDIEKLKTQGVFQIDKNSNLIKVVEKSPVFVSNLSNVGLYYFPNKVKGYLELKKLAEDKEELITDLIETYLQNNTVKIVSCYDYYYSISTMEDLTKAKI